MDLWVGTYAKRGGLGLYPVEIEGDSLRVGRPEPRIANASFAVHAPATGVTYFVDESEHGRITAWRRRQGAWCRVAVTDSGGSLPCYLSLSPDGQRLAVANYGNGTVALLAIDAQTGVPLGKHVSDRHSGRGPDPDRQDGPHAHCALFSPDGSVLYHVDLGLDRIFAYRVGPDGLQEPIGAFTAPAGSGPRHLVWRGGGSEAMLITELSAELMLLRREGERFALVQRALLSCSGTESENLGGHLALVDDQVLFTNRGEDNLVIACWAAESLGPRTVFKTGASPRHFAIAGHHVLVAEERQDRISLFRLDGGEAAGRHACDAATVPGAAFILALPSGG